MKSKIARFMNRPVHLQIATIKNLMRLLVSRLLRSLMGKPISILFHSEWGRGVLYSSLPKDELVICNTREGLRYIVNSSDQTIGRDVFQTQTSFDSENLLKSLDILGLQKKIILDVGANIGTIGVFAVSQGLVRECIAFEPEPGNFELLKANVQLNQLTSKFTMHNIALASDDVGSMLFELSPTNFGDHRISISKEAGLNREEERSTIEVPTNSLDRILSQESLADCLLFMDTQGFEGDILAGAKLLIDHKVPIVTEFCPYLLGRARGLEKFYQAFDGSAYTTIYDLNDREHRIDFSISALKEIADRLGHDDGRFTDLLIF